MPAQSLMEDLRLSADELIDASNGIYIRDPNIPADPKEARELWSESGGINFTMPDKLSEKRHQSKRDEGFGHNR